MSKKLLALLLSVIMIVTSVFTGMVVSAESATNYVGDGGFESADFSGTILNFGTGKATEQQTWGRFSSGVTRMELVTSDNYGSEDSVALNGNQYMKSGVTADGQYIRGFGQILSLTAGDYVLTFIAKSDVSDLFNVGIYGADVQVTQTKSDLAYTYLDASTTWQSYSIDFTITTDGTYNLIIGGNTTYSPATTNIYAFYMDNVAVYSKADIIDVDATAEFGGTVTGGGVVTKGETVTLTAAAKSGYEFAGWSDGVTTATRTITAEADVTLTAKFNKITADYVSNGDFESDDWSLSDYWTTLSGNSAFVEATDPTDSTNTVAYAKGGTAAISMVSNDTITLKDGHTYCIYFNSYMAEDVTGNGTSYYRVGFIKTGVTNLAGASFYGDYSSVYGNTTSATRGTWNNGYGYKYTHSGADAEAHIVLGLYNNECTSDWYVDNIVAYDTADLCDITATAENGTATGSVSGVLKGETVTLKATPDADGAKFLGWFAEDSDTAVSTSETWSFRATGTATYTAKYQGAVSTNLVVNGDFESDTNITTSKIEATSATGTWGLIETGVSRLDRITSANYVDADSTDFNGNAYMQSGTISSSYLRNWGQNVELEANTDYVLSFIAKSDEFINTSSKTVPIYAAVKTRGERLDAASDGIGGVAAVIETSTDWKEYEITFNSGTTTEAAVVFGNYSDVTTVYNYAIDNVVLSKATDYGVSFNVTSSFEDGATGWTTTGDAKVTTVNTADTALSAYTAYLGSAIGVVTPAAEGEVVTSPAFDTVVGNSYDVVIYIRRFSDGSKGKFAFSAGGTDESLKSAGYGADATGKYENNNGFLLIPSNADVNGYTTNTFTKLIFTFTATNTSHSISLTSLNAQSAYIDGFVVYCHEDIGDYVEDNIGFNGTAIRTTGTQGLRFKSSIDFCTLSNMGSYAKVVEYGTLAVREKWLISKEGEGAEITVDDITNGTYDYTTKSGTAACYLKQGVAYSTADGKDVIFSTTPYGKNFTGVLINIAESFYEDNYIARAYAKVQFADGSVAYVYGDQYSASVKGVAEYIVENNLETEEVRTYLSNNILSK